APTRTTMPTRTIPTAKMMATTLPLEEDALTAGGESEVVESAGSGGTKAGGCSPAADPPGANGWGGSGLAPGGGSVGNCGGCPPGGMLPGTPGGVGIAGGMPGPPGMPFGEKPGDRPLVNGTPHLGQDGR